MMSISSEKNFRWILIIDLCLLPRFYLVNYMFFLTAEEFNLNNITEKYIETKIIFFIFSKLVFSIDMYFSRI